MKVAIFCKDSSPRNLECLSHEMTKFMKGKIIKMVKQTEIATDRSGYITFSIWYEER